MRAAVTRSSVEAGEASNWLVPSRPPNAAMACAWDEPDDALDVRPAGPGPRPTDGPHVRAGRGRPGPS